MITLLLAHALAGSAEALEHLQANERLTARRLAEEALAANPEDFVAHYVMGEVYWKADGNLPRALHHLKAADHYYVRDKESLGEEAWRTHWQVLRSKAFVAENMEQTDLFLATVDTYNALYNPDLIAERAWPLMKDGRVDEARKVAETALASDDSWQISLGYNVLCALEAKVRDRKAAHQACMDALEFTRATGDGVVVDAYNAGTSAKAALDFPLSESLFRESAQAGSGTSTSPWEALSVFYLAGGRGADAVNAVRQMQRWRQAQAPADRAESQSSADATLALVLWVAGFGERGLDTVDRALARPDRRSSTTLDHATTRGMHVLIRRGLRRLVATEQAEEAAMGGFLARSWAWLGSWMPDTAGWADDAVLAGILQDGALLERSLAPYEDDGIVPSPFLAGELVEVLGPGVLQEAVDRGRTLDPYPGLQAYYDALEVEVAWHRGQRRALDLAEQALRDLPEHEVLLRARVAAIGAAAATDAGDPRAYGLYERALQLDPSSLRRLALPLPAAVSGSGASFDDALATMLARSPRFSRDPQGFQVVVRNGEACLRSPLGTNLGCHRGEPLPDETARLTSAYRAFHRGAFAFPLGLSLDDVRSLDSLTTLDAAARKQALDAVLGDL